MMSPKAPKKQEVGPQQTQGVDDVGAPHVIGTGRETLAQIPGSGRSHCSLGWSTTPLPHTPGTKLEVVVEVEVDVDVVEVDGQLAGAGQRFAV